MKEHSTKMNPGKALNPGIALNQVKAVKVHVLDQLIIAY
jgi:hypothetical protein